MNVLVPYMTNVNEWNWGLKTGWFYAGVGFPFALGMWFLIPETAGYFFYLRILKKPADKGALAVPPRNWMSCLRDESSRGDFIRRRQRLSALSRRISARNTRSRTVSSNPRSQLVGRSMRRSA
jgi:hypothetical protein